MEIVLPDGHCFGGWKVEPGFRLEEGGGYDIDHQENDDISHMV